MRNMFQSCAVVEFVQTIIDWCEEISCIAIGFQILNFLLVELENVTSDEDVNFHLFGRIDFW